jgi:signal transduction histidine kinase
VPATPRLLGVETVVQQLADEMVSALPVTVASVAIWEQPSYSLRVKAVSAARPLPVPLEVGARVPLAAARWHRAAFDRQVPVFVQPYSTTQEVSPDEACLSLIPDLHSVYLVPIRAGGETVGVLALGEMRAPDREPFGQDKRERCHALLAEFLATSAHAWEAGRVRRQVSAMSSLAGAVARIHDVGTYQEVLGCIASEVSDWLGAPVRGMILRAETSGSVEVVARWRLADDLAEADGHQFLAALARAGGTRGFPVGVASVAEDPLDPFHLSGLETASWTRVVLPVMRRDRLVGLACLYVEEELRLSDWELDAFQRRAELASVGMGIVEARQAQRSEQEWLGRAAWELLTTHQRTVIHEAIAGIARLVSSRLAARFDAIESPMRSDEAASNKGIVDAVVREVHDLLEELKAVAARPDDVQNVPLEVNDLVRRALDIARVRWEEALLRRGITVSLRFEPSEDPLVVEASIGLVGAVMHAVENAVEAVATGGQIVVRTARDDGHVVISVTDSGPALPEEVREAAFQPLFSTKGATRLGLGLSVVRAFAERHGGTATLSSGESGTELALRLPAHDPFRESLAG